MNHLFESKTIINTCKSLIENKQFIVVNTILNGLVYNVINVPNIPREMISYVRKNNNTYIILVESNGNGHITQMKSIIENLKDTFVCVGIIIGREKPLATKFAKDNQIPILNLHEPKYVSDQTTDSLVSETLSCIVEYSYYHYTTVTKFITSKSPEFIINLHLPIKILSNYTTTVFNISSQNRLNFDMDEQNILSENKFDKFDTLLVQFSSYMINNSHFRAHKIAIDCIDNPNVTTIPPLIKTIHSLSTGTDKSIVCYFNVEPHISFYRLFSNFPNIVFNVFLENIPSNREMMYLSDNIHFYELGNLFQDMRQKCIGVISSCGVESIYENFQLGLPMVCIPSNSEQLFNAYDHSRKIPGFDYTFELTKKHIEWLINFKKNTYYWKKHKQFKKYLLKDYLLKDYIKRVLDSP
tara:strand:- start:439 stop:1671 length:1233 start_codon:yes stop_codon:yes gene_type:complete